MTISSSLFNEKMLARFSDMNEAIQLRQSKISTGQAITAASDAPIDAVRLSALNEVTAQTDRFATNLTVAQRRLGLGDNTLASADNLYTRLREVQLSSASDTISASDRSSIKLEIEGINEQLLALANTADTSGQALFGGYATDLEPFRQNVDGSVSYMGDAGDHTLAAGDSLRLPTSINGGDVFMRVETGDSVHSVFDLVTSFAHALDASSEYTTVASNNAQGSVTLDLVSDRRPQNWAFDITGPKGTATVSFVAVDGNPEGAMVAINAAQAATGVTAVLSQTDGRSLELSTNIATGKETIAVTQLKIEGRELAEYPPSYFAKISPSIAGREALLTTMRGVAPVPDVAGIAFAPAGDKSAKFSLEGKEYTVNYTASGNTTAGTAAVTTTDGEADFITASVSNQKSLTSAAPVAFFSADDNSGTTFTINGFSADGSALTQTFAGPGAGATVTTTGTYKTITSIKTNALISNVEIGTSADRNGVMAVATASGAATLALDGILAINQDTVTLSVAGGTLDGSGPVPLNNNEAELLGLSSASAGISGAPQNTLTGRSFTVLGAGQSREMNVNLNGKTITVTHSKETNSPFGETVTTNETFATLNASGVEAGTGSTANIWTATSNSMSVTIEGVVLSATGTTANTRATALAVAINESADLAKKGITAQASTDGSGKLHVGTLSVKALASTDVTDYGSGSVPLATTQLTLSSDLLIGTAKVVSSSSAGQMGFDVSQQKLTDTAVTAVVPVSQGLAAHKEHMNALSESISVHRTVVGSRLQRADRQQEILADRALVLAQEVSDLSAADIEKLITELTSLLTSRDASRQAYSMISQSSLFDFIK